MTRDSELFCLFCLLLRYCTVFQATRSPCSSALFRLHSFLSLEAIKCTALFSICFHRFLRYYGYVGLPAIHLDSWRISLFWFSYLIRGNDRISAVPITYLSSTSPSSQTGGKPLFPHQIGYNDIVCCVRKHIDHFQPHNYFPAQSLHFHFGSVAPCPTLKPGVTASAPRTRYRRLARPYLIGFSYCIVISLPELAEFLPLARGNQLCWFHSSHS